MGLLETLRQALVDLALHKFRSALAALGIIFGVASVEAMMSISEGARLETMGRIAVLGVDNILVHSVKPPGPGPRSRARGCPIAWSSGSSGKTSPTSAARFQRWPTRWASATCGRTCTPPAAAGDDINRYVFIPLATARALYGDVSSTQDAGAYETVCVELDAIAMQMADAEAVLPTARRLENYLAKTHARKDYELLVPMELLRQKAATQRIFTIVMGSIAGISLLIGGIGIMNIMLANVYDRRKEIGVRRALGARRSDILRQFLLEAAALTSLGGLAGVIVGYGLAWGVSHYANWPTALTLDGAFLGAGVSIGVGILFGLWPAYQAASVNPIEALRFE
jgi:hypothetical protein